jgi:hypothetical protein
MNDRDGAARLDRYLRDLAAQEAEGDASSVDLTAVVVARVAEERVGTVRPRRPRNRRLRLAAAGVAALAVAACATVPPARAAVASLLHVAGIDVREGRAGRPADLGRELFDVGPATTVERAERTTDGRLLVPARLGSPDAVFQRGHLTTLVWGDPAKPDRPYWVVMEITEPSRPLLDKIVESTENVQQVTVQGSSALWISGPQELAYIGSDADGAVEDARTSGESLIAGLHGVTVRVETNAGMAAALRVGDSLR